MEWNTLGGGGDESGHDMTQHVVGGILEKGWRVEVTTRTAGTTAGSKDKVGMSNPILNPISTTHGRNPVGRPCHPISKII